MDLSAWTPPPIFAWLAEAGGVEEAEMLRAFNCGIGLAVICRAEAVETVRTALSAAGEAPIEIGRIVERAESAAPVAYQGALFS